jgi:hypothetical protein
MKTTNQTSTRKCSERGLDAERLADPLEPRRERGRHAEAGDEGERGGDEDDDEVGEQLQAAVGNPPVVERPVQRQVEDRAVEQPERVDSKVPPAREAD